MADSNPKKHKILVVDDETGILEILKEQIEGLGFEVITAALPSEGLRLIQSNENSLALIISDFKMPEMTGLEFRKAMLAEYKHIPFVMISGHVTREEALKAVEYKVAAFLEKPIQFDQLTQTIKTESQDRITTLNEESELLEGFVSDSEVLLEELENLLLGLEANPQNTDAINRVFAVAHTIKGSSGFFKPDTVQRFTHRYEDFFSPYKKGEKEITGEVIGVLLKGADTIRTLVRAMRTGKIRECALEECLKLFQNPESHSVSVATPKTLSPTSTPKGPSTPAPGVASEQKQKEELRVGIDLLDQFMELSGEITVIRNMINKLIRTIEKETGANKNVSHLSELFEEMHKINGTLQDKIVELRKVPLRNIFRPLQRTIRDLSEQLGKSIQLDLSGDTLRVDTSIAEVLSNSLIHMIRNSADHGIENMDERERAGKSKTGMIRIHARQDNEEVLVIIQDDGRGLNTPVLRKKIVEKGLRTETQAQSMSDSEVQSMIFESGFSTAAKVTDVSGRGVGMDMVKKSIQKIGGRVDIESTLGKGTRFILHLPIPKSVLIIPSLLVEAGQEYYTIPQDSIVRLVRYEGPTSEYSIQRLQGTDCLLSDGRVYPILNLNHCFNTQSTESHAPHATQIQEPTGHIILLKSDSVEYALWVTEILDLEDAVVKKLGPQFKHLPQFMGATFRGDGEVSLILDANGLAKYYGLHPARTDTSNDPLGERTRESNNSNGTPVDQTPLESLLLVDLHVEGTFAVRLNDVFRIENFSTRDLQRSGDQTVVLYRDSLMPIFDARSLLNLPEKDRPVSIENETDRTCVLVTYFEGRFIGFRIREVLDLVNTTVTVDTELKDRLGIEGGAIVQNRATTLIDLKELMISGPVQSTLRLLKSAAAENADVAA